MKTEIDIYCQVGTLIEATSPLTNKTTFINKSDSIFIIKDDSDLSVVRDIGSAQIKHWNTLSHTSIPRGNYRNALLEFSNIQTVNEYKKAINKLCSIIDDTNPDNVENIKIKSRAIDLLIRLWSENTLAWPTKALFESNTQFNYNDFTLKHHCNWVNEINGASASISINAKNRLRTIILRSVMTTIGISEIGDITQESVDMNRWPKLFKSYQGALKALMLSQTQHYGKAIVFPSSRWSKPLLGEVINISFNWAIDKNTDIRIWANLFTDWITQSTGNLVTRRTAAKHFLNYLLDYKTTIPEPTSYCRRDYHQKTSFITWTNEKLKKSSIKHRSKIINAIADFIDLYISLKLTLEDDFGRPVISPDHFNPITRTAASSINVQTHREAMPVRYINELITILTENDFAWPKRLIHDYFSWYDDEKRSWIRIWSPVRVIALLIKLHLPLRTFQVRMLDSGECDPEIYSNGEWILNDDKLSKLFPSNSPRGFLRLFEDRRVNRKFTGFYINTNKTNDKFKEPIDRGYEIPWQHDKVIKWSEMLRNWQFKYNKIKTPINWGDINERELLVMHSKTSLYSRGEVSFLFRDPCSPDRRYPIRSSKLSSMWKLLLDELEDRVFSRGEFLPNGNKIKFIKNRNDATGHPSSAVYDLHSLRVSLLTAYAIDGGVPIEILSKCIAGHASLLMTIYYIKTGPAFITEQLALAQEKIASKEKENFTRFLIDSELNQLELATAYTDSNALTAITETNPGSWVSSDKGICPMGGNRCSVGGPKLTNLKCRGNDYSPVPGGIKNCVRCRFFITGPAFLGGLVSHFNSIGFKLTELSRRYREQTRSIQETEDKLISTESDSSSNNIKKLDLLYEIQNQLEKEVDEMAHNWHFTYRLIERCKSILAQMKESKKKGSDKSINLVLAGTRTDFEVAIEFASDIEVINSICQVANIYPAEDTTLANLRRSRILDSMLVRNNCKPIFASLSEDDALKVGNEFTNFLLSKFGKNNTISLLEGTRMLESSGIKNDIINYLRNQDILPIELSRNVKGIKTNSTFSLEE
ncbi:MAG: hypothetical protein IV101_10420 [Dechloromonas sp.]|uniref:gamma-mobile-trio integrase GmtZ n=1 Tax=Dechloromonas sp. TaxID=1917218 RepID=UPI0027FC287F|nr:VPA1269 family protein [Dechloromonas sp.]MBT9521299.1 hypothetical protein [Dechloromonas sp.]